MSAEPDKRIAIYIPAFNAAKTITRVLDRIPPSVKSSVAEIFVIDNDSTDGTDLVAIEYKNRHNIHNLEVIKNPKNYGYGGSQKIAYRRCIEKNYDYVAMLHGDAQYAPELLEHFFQIIMKGNADMVFGSRMAGDPLAGGMPLIRFVANKFLTTMQNLFLGTWLSEFHSGYRVYAVPKLARVPFERLSSDYHFDTEIMILLLHHGFKIEETPIPTHYGDEKNYVNVWKYGIDVLVTTATYFFHKKRWRLSRNWARILS